MSIVAVVGTFDTKAAELTYIADRLRAAGVTVRTIDLATGSGPRGKTDVSADEV
ncbi:MAG: UPF0261 family protein, partial [Rhodobacteraceae bacterium]|nr:UPF0261 family protein [Paracoccaceae bacterium]